MVLVYIFGFLCIGCDCELKKVQEVFWKGELDEVGLWVVGWQLCVVYWQVQKDVGIQLLLVGDFVWYDQVLIYLLIFGVIFECFWVYGEVGLILYILFGMVCGVSDDSCCGGVYVQEMIKWFDINYYYLVFEFSVDQQFQLSWE